MPLSSRQIHNGHTLSSQNGALNAVYEESGAALEEGPLKQSL